eukprot:69524-Prorocentrum_minimum.AAC.3
MASSIRTSVGLERLVEEHYRSAHNGHRQPLAGGQRDGSEHVRQRRHVKHTRVKRHGACAGGEQPEVGPRRGVQKAPRLGNGVQRVEHLGHHLRDGETDGATGKLMTQRGNERRNGETNDTTIYNLTKSEEYQKHLQGVLYSTRGARTSKTLVTNVVNTRDSQEQAPRATYWFSGC